MDAAAGLGLPARAIHLTRPVTIDEALIEERFIHAAGPGGQNVNKVATSVELRFDAGRAGLPDDVRARLDLLAGRRMSQDSVLVLVARRFRTQERNRADARERLLELLREAAVAPVRRRATRPTLGSKRRRLEAKGVRADLKKGRSRPLQD